MAEEVASLFARLGLKISEAEWNRGDKIIENMKKAAASVAGIFAVHEVGEFIGATVEAGAHAQKLGEQVGISAESVSELAYAAKRSETDIETLTTAIGHAAHSLSNEIPKGTGPTLDALNKLGISTAEVKKIMSGPGGADDLLGMVSEKVSKLEPGLNKGAVAAEIFGAKMGAKLVPFLDNGADGIARLREEAHELGQTFTQEEAETMDTIEENWGRVKDGMGGVRNQIVTALAPVIKAAGEWLVGAMKEAVAWVRDHKDEIAAFGFAVGKVFVFVGQAIATAFRFVYDAITFVIDAIKAVVDVFAELGHFVMTLTKGAMAAAIAVWNFVRPIGKFFADAFTYAKERAIDFIDGVISVGRRIADFFVGVGQTIRDVFERVIHYVRYELPEQLKNLPVIGQIAKIGEFIGTSAGKVVDALNPDDGSDAGDPYTEWSKTNNGSKEDFERERAANMTRRGLAAPSPNGGAATAPGNGPTAMNGPSRVDIKVGDINVTPPPGGDAATYASTISTHVKQTFQEMFDTHLTNAAASVGEVPA